MMKFLLISSLVLSSPFVLPGQTVEGNWQKQLDDMKARIRALENENNVLKADHKSSDSLVYVSIRSEIFMAFINAAKLEADFRNTSEKIAITGLFTKLMQASNPTSDILGFRFTDIIFSSVEKHFISKLKDEHDRQRFSQVICKIIDNPIVTSLANSNPVTSVVASIISTIAGFSTSKVDLEKEGGRIKDVSVNQQDAIDSKSIRAFRDELQVYITFYDALINASNEFLQGIKSVNDKYDFLIGSIIEFKTELYAGLISRESNLLVELTAILPDPCRNDLDYSKLLIDPKIRKCLLVAEKFPALELEVNKLMTEYKQLLILFLSDYIMVLESAENFPDSDIDKSKTEALVNEIQSFINNLENN